MFIFDCSVVLMVAEFVQPCIGIIVGVDLLGVVVMKLDVVDVKFTTRLLAVEDQVIPLHRPNKGLVNPFLAAHNHWR